MVQSRKKDVGPMVHDPVFRPIRGLENRVVQENRVNFVKTDFDVVMLFGTALISTFRILVRRIHMSQKQSYGHLKYTPKMAVCKHFRCH